MMIGFASSKDSYRQLAASSAWPPDTLWILPDVLTAEEIDRLRAAGIKLTCFTHAFDASDKAALAIAVGIIQEHHPEQPVWVDGVTMV